MLTTLKQPKVWIPLLVVILAVLVIALYLFQPWKLFVNQTVDEALPSPAITSTSTVPTTGATPSPSETPKLTVLKSGSLVDQEHATSGTVRIIEIGGKRTLRLENLDTSNGPDLHVWLSASPIEPGQAGWFNYDDTAYLPLGALKGNQGNQNYPIPTDADLAKYRTAVIWCDRFNVAFGAATLN